MRYVVYLRRWVGGGRRRDDVVVEFGAAETAVVGGTLQGATVVAGVDC